MFGLACSEAQHRKVGRAQFVLFHALGKQRHDAQVGSLAVVADQAQEHILSERLFGRFLYGRGVFFRWRHGQSDRIA
jgi:hypothetical protein